jgi:N-acetylglucosaminyldiphosphoundecaprenol N-acetyl-beta-D-mannosaminyltransferase
VHSVVTARQDPAFRRVLAESDLNTADGVPLVWAARAAGHAGQQRVAGPDLINPLCRAAAQEGVSIFLYGSTPEVLAAFRDKLVASHPDLTIAGAISPPFRALSDAEKSEIVDTIKGSGARIVWVGLGCPKQEKWMWEHRPKLNTVMIGVGAAFDYEIGRLRRAPSWMQRAGLEWAYRLIQEPSRLFRRYAVTNTLFIAIYAKDALLRRSAGLK